MNRDFENENEFDLGGARDRGQGGRYGAGSQGTPASGQSARRPVSTENAARQGMASGQTRRPAAPSGQPGGSRAAGIPSGARRPEQSRMSGAGTAGAPRGGAPASGAGSRGTAGYGTGGSADQPRQRQAAPGGPRSAGRPSGAGQPGTAARRPGENGAGGAPAYGAASAARGVNSSGAARGAAGGSAAGYGGANGSGTARGAAGGSAAGYGGANGSGTARGAAGGSAAGYGGANGSGTARGAAGGSAVPRGGAAAGSPSQRPGVPGSGAGSRYAASGQAAASKTERPRFTGESGRQGGQSQWVDLPAGGRGGERQGRSGAADRKDGKEPDPQVKAVKRRRRTIITMIIVECIALCLIFGARYFVQKMNLIKRDNSFDMNEMTNPNLIFEKKETMEKYWTIALFGVDSRDNSLGRGNNSDVNIICNVNQETGEIKLVSVFRDSYLNLDDKGSYNKINQAYFLGGPEQAINALNKNLDLQIDDYAVFNWKAVIDAINILGGVDVELSKAEFYYINAFITETVKATGVGSYQLTHAGMNHLDGVQAVAYARLRKMDTDFARTERQRKVIQLAFDKLKKADFAKINNVMEVVLGQIQSSVTLDDIIPAAKNLTKYYIGATTGFPQARDDVNMGKKGDCVIPATLESNVTLLHQFLFDEENYEPSDMVKSISAKIAQDTGKYKAAKPIDHVGTDGGYIPKPTQATKPAPDEDDERETTKADETTVETSAVIDGEDEDGLELETDEFGNVIDPPEGDDHLNPSGSSGYPGTSQGYPGTSQGYPGSSQGYPGTGQTYPGSNGPSNSDGTTKPSTTAPYPGAPGTTTTPDDTSGPGVTAPSTSAVYPGSNSPGGSNSPYNSTTPTRTVQPTEDNNSGGPDSVITGPGGR